MEYYEVTDIADKVISEQDGWVKVAIKATIENQSDDKHVVLEIQGVDSEGFAIDSIHLSGLVPIGQSKILTNNQLIEKSIFEMIAHWQPIP